MVVKDEATISSSVRFLSSRFVHDARSAAVS